MGKIQVDSGRSSAATHRLTQVSTTLNRRYVRRPSNLAVDAAAHAAELREQANTAPRVSPSRLVNLGVRATELEKAQAAATRTISTPQVTSTAPKPISITTPNIVEFGCDPTEAKDHQPAEIPTPVELAPDPLIATPEPIVAAPEPIMVTPDPIPETPAVPEVDTAALAASIAADYAATSLGISLKEFGNGDNYAMPSPTGEAIAPPVETPIMTAPIETPLEAPTNSSNDSVEAIALAASNAIASIRAASDPNQVSEQVASLQAFADNIKSNPQMPEMRELGDTIDKFVSIAMKSTKVQEENERKAAEKVTLSPKVTRAAAKVTKSSAKVVNANNRAKARAAATPMRAGNVARPMTARPMARRAASSQLKGNAIESALATVATMDERGSNARKRPAIRRKTGAKRFAIAFTCAAACVAAVIYFVGANIPDISVRVAAMQTGIQASYPSFIPRDYSLGDISSEAGKITMVFNGPDNAAFKLIEEKSSWDSPALLRNYVEPSWGEEYATTHEQGITIYISEKNSDAAWVNGGVLYKITSSGTPLTKKQVRSIVTSM